MRFLFEFVSGGEGIVIHRCLAEREREREREEGKNEVRKGEGKKGVTPPLEAQQFINQHWGMLLSFSLSLSLSLSLTLTLSPSFSLPFSIWRENVFEECEPKEGAK